MTGRMANVIGYDVCATTEVPNKPRYKSWEKQIRDLMSDFCVPKREIDSIVKSVKEDISIKTDEMRYHAAHRKFKKAIGI